MTANNGPFLFEAVILLAEPRKAGNSKPTSPHLSRFIPFSTPHHRGSNNHGHNGHTGLLLGHKNNVQAKTSQDPPSPLIFNHKAAEQIHHPLLIDAHMALRIQLSCQRNPGCSIISAST